MQSFYKTLFQCIISEPFPHFYKLGKFVGCENCDKQ